MKDLIEALQIFLKYSDLPSPTYCRFDTLYVIGVEDVSDSDRRRLGELGFHWDDREWTWQSFRFGSA